MKLGGSSGSGSDSDSGNDVPPVGTGNGQDNGNDSSDDGQTLTGIETGVATYTSDGVIIVSHGISVQDSSSTSASLSSSTTSSSSTSAASSSNKSGTNGGSIVHVPVSLVLALVGAVAIGAF